MTSCDPYHFVRALVPRVAINYQSSILGTYMGCWATNPAMLGPTTVITQVSKAMKGKGGGKNLGFQETIHTGSLTMENHNLFNKTIQTRDFNGFSLHLRNVPSAKQPGNDQNSPLLDG